MFTVFNNAKGRLDGPLSAAGLLISLDGTFAPDPAGLLLGGDAFWDSQAPDENTKPTSDRPEYITLIQYNDQSGTEATAIDSGIAKREIVRITTISGDSLTIDQRGVGETAAQAFDTSSYVYKFVVAQEVQSLLRLLLSVQSRLPFTW